MVGSSPAEVFQDVEEEEPASSGGRLWVSVLALFRKSECREIYGRKLQAEAGRLETRENIWVKSFCWRATS